MNKQIIYLLASATLLCSVPGMAQTSASHHKSKPVPAGCPTESPVHHHRKPVVPEVETIIINSPNTTAVVEFIKGKIYVNDSQIARVKHCGYDDYTVRVNYIAPPAPVNMEKINAFSGFSTGKPLLGVVTCNSCQEGATIEEVISCSPAEKAGLYEGDVITKINDKEINNKAELADAIAGYKAGDDVTVTYRRCGMDHTANAELGDKEKVENSDCANMDSYSECGGCYAMRRGW